MQKNIENAKFFLGKSDISGNTVSKAACKYEMTGIINYCSQIGVMCDMSEFIRINWDNRTLKNKAKIFFDTNIYDNIEDIDFLEQQLRCFCKWAAPLEFFEV